MRRFRATGLVLTMLLLAPVGCLDAALLLNKPRPAPKSLPLTPAAADALFLQTVLIEQPIGDAFLNGDLWTTAPSAVPPERRALLAENGLRAAVVCGNPPPRFVELVTSDLATVNPQFLTFSVRKEDVIPTNGPLEACSFNVLTDLGGERAAASFKQATFGWRVKPEATSDGRVKLICEPQVQHGDRQEWLRPSADGTQFTLQGEVPLERFATLGFEVTLGPREYLVIGCDADMTESLGEAFFRVPAGGQVRQRVLVIRAGRGGDSPGDEVSLAGPKPRGGPPIAAEAAKGRGGN